MRKTVLGTVAFILWAQTAWADVVHVDLNPADPKYKTPQCVALRQKAQNYESIFQQSAGNVAIAAVMPGGTAGLAAIYIRKRDMFKYEVEKACLTNPPKRPYLDPSGTATKD
jgi:hypothetical protein